MSAAWKRLSHGGGYELRATEPDAMGVLRPLARVRRGYAGGWWLTFTGDDLGKSYSTLRDAKAAAAQRLGVVR